MTRLKRGTKPFQMQKAREEEQKDCNWKIIEKFNLKFYQKWATNERQQGRMKKGLKIRKELMKKKWPRNKMNMVSKRGWRKAGQRKKAKITIEIQYLAQIWRK